MGSFKKATLDSKQLAFFKQKLEYMLAKVFQKPYPALSARAMFPVSAEGGEGIDSVAYEIWDEQGIAEFISAYAGDIPRVDVSSEKVTVPVHRMAASFGMTLDDIKKAMRTGVALSNRKAMAVRNGHEQTLNKTAFLGNSRLGLQGLFSHTSIPNGVAPYLDWDTGTPATALEMLACFKAGIKAIATATSSVEIVTAIRVPSTLFTHIGLEKLNDNTEMTVLDWLQKKLAPLGVTEIAKYQEGEVVTHLAGDPVSDLTGVTSSEVRVITYYDNSVDALELMVPEDMNFLEPQQEGLEQVTIGTMSTGGLNVYKPLSLFCQVVDS